MCVHVIRPKINFNSFFEIGRTPPYTTCASIGTQFYQHSLLCSTSAQMYRLYKGQGTRHSSLGLMKHRYYRYSDWLQAGRQKNKRSIPTNNKLRGKSPRENYTERSDRRLSAKLVPTFADRGCSVVSVTDTYGRILGFLDRSRYFFFQAAPQLYSRGWVDPVPDPLLLRKSGSAGNRTRTSGSVARNSGH
jgi:hypothetical protein